MASFMEQKLGITKSATQQFDGLKDTPSNQPLSHERMMKSYRPRKLNRA